MKPLPIRLFVMGFAWLVLGSSITAKRTPQPAALLTNYYWFTDDNDVYDRYASTDAEIANLQAFYGVPVNTNPAGGTPLRDGYINNTTPHNVWPSLILYGHW